MSLGDCLKKIGLSAEELRIYDSLVAKHQSDGLSARDAQRKAAESRLSELTQDKDEVQAKIKESMPEPAITEDIQVEEITNEEERQRILEEFAALSEVRRGGLQTEENTYTTISGQSAAIGWSEATSIIRNGKPAIVHRGANTSLESSNFDQASLGAATGHPSSGLGVFLSSDYSDASGYGSVVESVHLDIRNPKIYTEIDMPAFDSVQEAFAHRESLREQGHDGIIIDFREVEGPVNYVAFDADQVIHPPKAEDVKTFYQGAEDYQGEHKPPSYEDGAPLNDLTDGIYPDDIYSSKGLQYYGTGQENADRESMSVIRSMKGRPKGRVKIYRAVPDSKKEVKSELKEVNSIISYYSKWGFFPNDNKQFDEVYDFYNSEWKKEENKKWTYDEVQSKMLDHFLERSDEIQEQVKDKTPINSGDWVSLSKSYAKEHGEREFGKDYKVITKTVNASELFTNGDSINEFGYWDKADRPIELKDQGDVALVETGKPVTFHFIHNTESATKLFGKPKKGAPYGREFEPAARFINIASKKQADEIAAERGQFISGKLTFRNPLVMPNDGLKWKETLSKQYGGKVGKKLSLALIADGYDGIITTEEKYITETIDLTTFDESLALFQSDEKDLFVAHNISAENIIHAAKVGGLAVPSLAIARTTTGFESFGEVSLIADKSLLQDPYAKTFGADIYSPRYPSVNYKIDIKEYNKVVSPINEKIESLGIGIVRTDIEGRGIQELYYDKGIRYAYLDSIEKAPKLKFRKKERLPAAFKKFKGSDQHAISSKPEFKKAAEDYYRKKAEYHARTVSDSGKGVDEAAEEGFKGNEYEYWLKDWTDTFFNDNGNVRIRFIDELAYDVVQNNRPAQVDGYDLDTKLNDKLKSPKSEAAFKSWIEDKFSDVVAEERIFQGYTPSGNRKYIAHNLDNVVKLMKKELRGGENFNYGVGTIRSGAAPQFRTIKQIQNAREKITDKATMDSLKEETSSEFTDLVESMRPYYKYDGDGFGYLDAASENLYEMARGKGLQDYVDLPVDLRKNAAEFISKLRDMPTEYFESKVQRAVGIEEFDTAVVPKGMRKDALQVLKNAGLKIKTYDPKVDGSRADVIANQEKLLFQPTRASIQFTKDNESIIRLTRASDLSSFLHESGHLFLEMEKRFADKFGQTEDQKVLLDWLGVNSFDEIEVKHHEKFAETFEVYLREGKSPSLKLREAFAAFARWLTIIYRKLVDSRLAGADLSPEIKEYMDRMLATEVEIEQAMANPAYDQLFRSKEQAGMDDDQWSAYQKQASKAKTAATSDLNQKVIDELRKRKTKEWKEEREPLIEEETERLSKLPVYEAINLALENPMDANLTRVELGMTSKQRFASGSAINTKTDSLLVAAAKKGGLNMEIWEREFVDPEYLKDKDFNNQVFGRPIFRKNKGMAAEDLAELANELGYGIDVTAKSVLDLVDRELSGNPVFTPEGIEANAEMDTAEYYDLEVAGQKKTQTKVQKLLKRITTAGGVDPAEYSEAFGYTSVTSMINEMSEAKPLNKAAYAAAEARMVEKYGDMLNDGRIELEARESVHNEEQAKLLLHEIRALSRGKSKINREYLKAEAKTLIGEMTYKEMQPSRFYRAEIKAAQNAATASTDADKLKFKVQQIANHYLYKEATETKEAMDKQRKYVRRVQKHEYKAAQVAPDFSANMRTLANLYDLRVKPDQIRDVTGILEWYDSQMSDENRFVDIALLDPNLILAYEAKKRGELANLNLPTFDELTADDLRGLTDMIKHLRYVGGQMSDTVKAEAAADRRQLAESITELGGKDVKTTKGVPRTGEKAFRQAQHLINKIPSLRNLVRMLDGFSKDDDGVAARMLYRTIENANSHKIDIAREIYEKFETEMNDIHKVGLSRKLTDYQLEEGGSISMHPESRYMLALYWGVESSRQAVRDGFGFTDKDVETILSDMTEEQLKLVNATWSVNESMWPELAKAHIALYGVAPPKLTATPFEINGVKLTGGHMRLFYDSSELELKGEQEQSRAMSAILPTKAGSLNARVGSGGRPPLLDKTNIVRAIEDNIHYIAFAEPSNKIRSLINSKEVKSAIEKKHGEGFYRALIENIDGVTGNHISRETIPAMAAIFKLLRRAATFKHLAYSIRNTVQQVSAIPVAMEEVGVIDWMNHMMQFSTPTGHARIVNFVTEKSKFMSDRASLVNREANEYLRHITTDGKAHHMWNEFAKFGFTPQTITDSIIAFPTWMARYEQGINSHGDESRAVSDADTAVAESVGSGSDLHLGGVFQSNNTEFVKMFTVFGTWFNAYYQRVYKSTEGLTTIANADAAKSLLITPFIVAVMSSALVMDLPDDDEEFMAWAMKRYAAFMAGTVPIVRDAAGAFSGFSPKTVFSGGAETPARLVSEIGSLIEGRQTGLKATSDITKLVTTVVPVPGVGNITRVMDYMDSRNRGKEPEFNAYQAIVSGPTRK